MQDLLLDLDSYQHTIDDNVKRFYAYKNSSIWWKLRLHTPCHTVCDSLADFDCGHKLANLCMLWATIAQQCWALIRTHISRTGEAWLRNISRHDRYVESCISILLLHPLFLCRRRHPLLSSVLRDNLYNHRKWGYCWSGAAVLQIPLAILLSPLMSVQSILSEIHEDAPWVSVNFDCGNGLAEPLWRKIGNCATDQTETKSIQMPCSALIISGGGVIAGLDHRSWDKVCHCRPDPIWKMSTPSTCSYWTPSTLCYVWIFRPISWFMGSLLCLARQKSWKSLAQDNWHPSGHFSNRSLKASSPAWFHADSSGCKVHWSRCGRYMVR